MRLRAMIPLTAVVAGLLLAWQVLPWEALLHRATSAQREFQEAMARALRAVQRGEPAALASLCAATALYGAVHAAGPGHGKVLLGGGALASGATLRRMAALTILSSFAQAGVAVALAGLLALLLRMGAMRVGEVADAWLAPASYAAIAAMGVFLIVRGLRLMRPAARTHRAAHATSRCGCGHAHGPTVQEAASLAGWREGAALVGSIAIRPCTGALFLLAIALRLDLYWTGTLAVLAMGLGTAAFNLAVAGSGVLARRAALAGADGPELRALSAGAHVLGGALIAGLSLLWLARLV